MNGCPTKKQSANANLVVVSYIEGSTRLRRALASQTQSDDVTIDSLRGVWYFMKGTPHEASFTIGSGVRVPEDKEFWGPMMVYDPTNIEHVAAVRVNQRQLGQGILSS